MAPSISRTSFTGQAMAYGLNHDILFPVSLPTEEAAASSGCEFFYHKILGEGLAGVARYVYMVACQLLFSPMGFVYHVAMALGRGIGACFLGDPEKKAAWQSHSCEHLLAGFKDLISLFFLALGIFVIPVAGNLPALEYAFDPKASTLRFQHDATKVPLFVAMYLKESRGRCDSKGNLLPLTDQSIERMKGSINNSEELRKTVEGVEVCTYCDLFFGGSSRAVAQVLHNLD